ncbi:protein of unknown function [Maridesulfovibrio hydrothermalis AM13 = DSM 14728]|uniref:Uncharacterized protein n=1 Tax=Maridesulfovibrio hydrothermalis AM13 = DSM 14728 TaxID=1121451 RepID=L0R822_9BACT|nr:protein of unknown function [Maridesulfovibrio hydrothermalis AM13 = DSM 14728]
MLVCVSRMAELTLLHFKADSFNWRTLHNNVDLPVVSILLSA